VLALSSAPVIVVVELDTVYVNRLDVPFTLEPAGIHPLD